MDDIVGAELLESVFERGTLVTEAVGGGAGDSARSKD